MYEAHADYSIKNLCNYSMKSPQKTSSMLILLDSCVVLRAPSFFGGVTSPPLPPSSTHLRPLGKFLKKTFFWLNFFGGRRHPPSPPPAPPDGQRPQWSLRGPFGTRSSSVPFRHARRACPSVRRACPGMPPSVPDEQTDKAEQIYVTGMPPLIQKS